MRGNLPLGYQLMRESDPRLFKIPAIVEAELYLGALKSNNPKSNKKITERFLLPYERIPFNTECAVVYGNILAHLESKGNSIGPNDLLIAATALAKQAVLVTNNQREFKRVPGLEIETWAEVPC